MPYLGQRSISPQSGQPHMKDTCSCTPLGALPLRAGARICRISHDPAHAAPPPASVYSSASLDGDPSKVGLPSCACAHAGELPTAQLVHPDSSTEDLKRSSHGNEWPHPQSMSCTPNHVAAKTAPSTVAA
eukprot:3203335-Prymnesium_polylepis.2